MTEVFVQQQVEQPRAGLLWLLIRDLVARASCLWWGDSAMPRKNPAAVKLGRLGGAARAKRLSKRRRKEIARLGALARWEKARGKC